MCKTSASRENKYSVGRSPIVCVGVKQKGALVWWAQSLEIEKTWKRMEKLWWVVGLWGKLHQLWNFIHVILTTMCLEAAVMVSYTHTHNLSGVSKTQTILSNTMGAYGRQVLKPRGSKGKIQWGLLLVWCYKQKNMLNPLIGDRFHSCKAVLVSLFSVLINPETRIQVLL